MKKVTKAEEERAAKLSDWAENLDGIPADAVVVKGSGNQPGRALLESALGSPEAVDRAIRRPSLDGRAGKSPVRQVRLPRDLDALLVKRAEAEGRKPSEVVREALSAYLDSA